MKDRWVFKCILELYLSHMSDYLSSKHIWGNLKMSTLMVCCGELDKYRTTCLYYVKYSHIVHVQHTQLDSRVFVVVVEVDAKEEIL